MDALESTVPVRDRREIFGPLVSSEELRVAPVHRWFTYKEGFSPALLGAVLSALGVRRPVKVADVFGGVATTGLSGRVHQDVSEVRSLEYSPWAHFAGSTKLAWPELDPDRLGMILEQALRYPIDEAAEVPALSTLSNPRVFDPSIVREVVSARQHVAAISSATEEERAFFLLGIGSVIEDLSYAMKDGRALRIRRDRKRKRSSLVVGEPPPGEERVRFFLRGQWSAMIRDLHELAGLRETAAATPAVHVAGDARRPAEALLPDGSEAFPTHWADIACFSPPYLNCIDYTELYKLELWLMGHVTSQSAFRDIRLGTLRSHPSVKFPESASFSGVEDNPAVEAILAISAYLTENGARKDIGPIVRTYFEDMLDVWRGQRALLGNDGIAVCVVANSTFARRTKLADGRRVELWRLPLLTDVLLAHLARLAGFEHVEIWAARSLRARNVRAGTARESLVVARSSAPDA